MSPPKPSPSPEAAGTPQKLPKYELRGGKLVPKKVAPKAEEPAAAPEPAPPVRSCLQPQRLYNECGSREDESEKAYEGQRSSTASSVH